MFKKIYTPISNGLDNLDDWYERRINWAVRHRATVIISCLCLFVVSISLASIFGIKSEFFPANDSGRIGVSVQLPIGTRVEISEEVAKSLVKKWQDTSSHSTS